jgi:hypothetical protein
MEPSKKNIPSVKIIIATHKKYRMPGEHIYLPLHVGAEGKLDVNGNELNLGYIKDNTGENISKLNASFCELTGLYWAWKNLKTDYIGLVHYRRHFCIKKNKELWKSILDYEQLKVYLKKVKVFTPTKRRYYIETLYSHYKHTHYSVQLDETRKIIEERYPEYITSYNRVLKHTYGYMFNMMIMEKTCLSEYCSWLFDILFELRKKIDMPALSSYQGRFYGRVSEILFNVWLDYQLTTGRLLKNQIKEISCIHLEGVNWRKKGRAFLKAKFFGKKYKESF